MRQAALAAFDHQEYPFALLVEQLNPPRDPSRSAIFETTINLMRAQQMGVLPERGAPATAPNGLHAEVYPLEQQAGQFDLMLDIIEDGSAPHALFSYNTDLFEEGTIRRMAGHYLALLASIVADPDQAVDAIPLLTPAERELMLVEWNHTEAPYPSDRCVHDLVAGQAARTPEQIAARCGDARMSYGELERRANQLAHHLRMLGVGPGALAGVFMNRSLDMLVALLGVLKAGGAYVPLDPGFPAERLALMLEDSRAPIILTEEALAASAPPTNAHLLRIDSDWAQIAQQPETTPPPLATAADLAYVIFTSGSTGRPKGVQIPHRAVVNFLTSMAHTPGLAPDDLLVAVTTLSFDIAVLELFLPLIVGAQVDCWPARPP